MTKLLKTFFLLTSLCLSVCGNCQKKSLVDSKVHLKDTGESIIAMVDDKPVFEYNYKTKKPPKGKPDYYQRSGFIHPVFSPSGAIITEGFPQKHTHHHGIFTAWVDTEFKGKEIDFWNQQKKTGTVIFKKILILKEEDSIAHIKTEHNHVALIDQDTIPVLQEIWDITVYNSVDPFIWDIKVEQKNISTSDLNLKKYHYGGIAFRGRDEWDQVDLDTNKNESQKHFDIVTNQQKSREKANHTKPDWVTLFGDVNGNTVSLSVIPFSGDAAKPEFVRIHPSMPYFCFTPVLKKGIIIKPGDVLRSRYRILTTDGIPESHSIIDVIKR